MVSDEAYMACRAELDATRQRRDECEVKMRKAFERVTAAEEALEKCREHGRQLWENALKNSSHRSELHQMLLKSVKERYERDINALRDVVNEALEHYGDRGWQRRARAALKEVADVPLKKEEE